MGLSSVRGHANIPEGQISKRQCSECQVCFCMLAYAESTICILIIHYLKRKNLSISNVHKFTTGFRNVQISKETRSVNVHVKV